MGAYLRGQRNDISDGVTHQIWEWTNVDIFRLINPILPPGSATLRYRGDPSDNDSGDEEMKIGGSSAGYVTRFGLGGGTDEGGHPITPPNRHTGEQRDRFNDKRVGPEELPVDSDRLRRLREGISSHVEWDRRQRRSDFFDNVKDILVPLLKVALFIGALVAFFKFGIPLLRE